MGHRSLRHLHLNAGFPRLRRDLQLNRDKLYCIHVILVLPHAAGRRQAPAGRRSCVAPGRRKIPRCGAFARLAWTARRAAPGRRSWALLDVALSSLPPCITQHHLPSLQGCTPHAHSGARSSDGFLPFARFCRAPSTRSGHQGFLFCK